MKRVTLIFGMIFLSALVYMVFQVEHRVQEHRSELAELNRQLVIDREAIHVLNAEWSYLTRPERLKEMSEKYLETGYINVSQVKDIEAVPLKPYENIRQVTMLDGK